MSDYERLLTEIKVALPLKKVPLVHCITNEITCETMANALLYVNGKPLMADDPREFPEFFAQNDSLLLNLGHISPEKVTALVAGATFAQQTKTPAVLDLVGVSATKLRYDLAWEITKKQPAVIKGNLSEMRAFCGLASKAWGVDASFEDQTTKALAELKAVMEKVARKYQVVLLATGPTDLVVASESSYTLSNGVPQLDRFTGSGDLLGAIIAALLGSGVSALASAVTGVSYLNLCGEQAKEALGLGAFRSETLNQLSLLMDTKWWQQIRRQPSETD